MIILVMAGLAYVVNSLSVDKANARRAQQTRQVLAQAREALVGYALRYREDQIADGQLDRVYGYLPLPDLGTSRNNNSGCTLEGCDAANFTGNALNTSIVGRLPWRTLGLPPLRDGDGECLWYIVSGSHQRQQRVTPMNWDTLGHLDILAVNSSSALASALSSAHDRPVAVIFSAGQILPGQDRSNSASDAVSICGGNYNSANYLDAAGAVANYLSGTNNATAVTGDSDPSNDPDTPQPLLTRGKLYAYDGETKFREDACTAGDCVLKSNDAGRSLSGDQLFKAVRRQRNFRTDIDALMERITSCLRDEFVSGTVPSSSHARIAGADTHACYGQNADPKGYYPHYKDMIFVAKPSGGANVTVDGVLQSGCAGALIFANQRTSSQYRRTEAERSSYANYLEGTNFTSFSTAGSVFVGSGRLQRTATGGQDVGQDLVRCIPSGASFSTVQSASLTALGMGQLATYDATSRTLALGQVNVDTGHGAPASGLFGCAWNPQATATEGGVRAYFKFYIYDTGTAGDGFTFALADGDANSAGVCGAARQHLGYSGNNGSTPIVKHPKIGIEFDTTRNYRSAAAFTDPTGFNPAYVGASPASTSYLSNGTADPNYTGGHIGIVYWGGETDISTGLACGGGCTSPQVCSSGICYLPAEYDDNVHGRSATVTGNRPPPQNPVAPSSVPTELSGVYKLDPSLSSVPKTQDIHVRVELTRIATAHRTVQALAASNQALAGIPVIDGVALAAGNRLLLVGQADSRENGVWDVAAGAWVRSATEDAVGEIPLGTVFKVNAGTVYGGTFWRLNSAAGFNPGTSANSFKQVPVMTRSANPRPVRLVATSTVATAGTGQTIDGGTVVAGDRILLTAQADGKDNGVWVAAVGNWARATSDDEVMDMPSGTAWIVREGTTNAWTYWQLTNPAGYLLGATALTIAKTTAPWSAIATSPVALSGLAAIGAVTPVDGDWVLVTAQADSSENGIYMAKAGNWQRIPMYQESYDIRAWVLKDSVTDAVRIGYLSATSRSMASLDATYTALLADTATIYSPQAGNCSGNYQCATSGYWCGIDNICYRPGLRTLRPGFTIGQGSRDQRIDIKDFATTWLP